MANETLWTGFNNQKLFAERARKDEKGRNIANAIDSIPTTYISDASTNNGTLTLTKEAPGGQSQITFTGDENVIEVIYQGDNTHPFPVDPLDKSVTIPIAGSAVEQGQTVYYGGLLNDNLSEKLQTISDGATRVEASSTPGDGTILIDNVSTTVYTHPAGTQAAAAAVKVGSDALGHVVLGSALTASDVGITVTSSSVSDGTNTLTKHIADGTTITDTNNTLSVNMDTESVTIGGTTTTYMTGINNTPIKAGMAVLDSDGNNIASAITALQNTVNARADFSYTSYSQLPTPGDPSKVYYVHSQQTGADQYDVYVWNTTLATPAYTQVDEASISLDGYWNGAITYSGSGTVVSDVSVDTTTGAVTVTKSSVAVPTAYTSNPEMDGTASPGTSNDYAKGDHVHPSDTSKQDVLTFDGTYNSTTNPAATVSTVTTATSGKANLVSGATADNFASLTSGGDLADSGYSASSFATAAEGALAASAIQGVKVAGASTAIQPDASNVVTVPNVVSSTGASGGSSGLMLATDKEALDTMNTWTQATFGDNGIVGSESSVTFPVSA